MARIGGSMGMNGTVIFGGSEIGRGIRSQRYLGRARAIGQLEARYNVFDFDLFSQNFDLGLVGFTGAGSVAENWSDITKTKGFTPHFTYGGGLRIGWNKNFVIRVDLGFSPSEDNATKLYLKIGNVF